MFATLSFWRLPAWMLPTALMVLAAAASVHAHVGLDSPNGGESLTGDSTFMVEWHIIIPHDTLDWDLWYSTASATGPWTIIAEDLPFGDPTSHLWSVPDIDAANAWVRVRMDNDVQPDYEDVSAASFSIVASPSLRADYNGNGVVDASDYTVWRDTLGQTGMGLPADGDDSDEIDQGDYDVWKLDFGQALASGAAISSAFPLPPSPLSAAIPEPNAGLLWLLGMTLAVLRRR